MSSVIPAVPRGKPHFARAVFAGGFGLDTAEAVCGSGALDVLDVADLLGSLVDKSLVVAEPAGGILRYRLLETIRLFAAERLAEAGDSEAAAVAAAHCAHFLALAEAAAAHLTGPDQGSWLARLEADEANLRRAAGYAAGRPAGTAVVLRLGVALERFWRARSREPEAFGLLVPVLRRPDAGAEPSLNQARAHLDDEQLERAYTHGMALGLDKALDLALSKSGSGMTATTGKPEDRH